MAFSYLWDSTFESLPDNNTYAYLIDDYFRQLYIAIRERMQVDHQWKNGQLDGEHKKVTLLKSAEKPIAVATHGFVYTKDVGAGAIELFFEDAAGNELQLTSAGKFNPQYVFPVGTKAIFYQNTAPTGWTIDTTLDDKLLFVTKGAGAGGQTGGTVHSTGTWTISGITGGDHVLTIAEMPSHRHDIKKNTSARDEMYGYGQAGDELGGEQQYSGYTGGGAAHSHGVSHDGAWRPAAYCVIIASKD